MNVCQYYTYGRVNITDVAVFVCLVTLCHFSALSAFINVVFAFAYFEIKAVFSIKRALRCFSPSYGSVSFSLNVAMVLWLNQELVYWPKSDRKTHKRRRAFTRISPFTRLSVPHRAPTAALSGGKHWINVRDRLGPATDAFRREISLMRAIIMRKMVMVMTLQRSGRAVRTQQTRSRDLLQLGGCLRSRDRCRYVTCAIYIYI